MLREDSGRDLLEKGRAIGIFSIFSIVSIFILICFLFLLKLYDEDCLWSDCCIFILTKIIKELNIIKLVSYFLCKSCEEYCCYQNVAFFILTTIIEELTINWFPISFANLTAKHPTLNVNQIQYDNGDAM